MIRINLGKSDLGGKSSNGKAKAFFNIELPPALKARMEKLEVTGTSVVVMGVSVALALLCPLLASQYQQAITRDHNDEMKTLSQHLTELTSQVDTYTPFKRELQSYEDQKKLVSDRLAVVRKLLEQRNAPVNTLDAISQSLPPRAWVLNMEANLETPASLTLAGLAYSNEEISDFLDSLSRSVYLANVNLEDVASKTDDKVELKSFMVSAQPKGKSEVAALPPANSNNPSAAAALPSAPVAQNAKAPNAQGRAVASEPKK